MRDPGLSEAIRAAGSVSELARRGGKPGMGEPERGGIGLQRREPAKELGVRRAREQQREERIFLRPRRVDLVNLALGHVAPLKQIGPQQLPPDAGRLLDGDDAIGGNSAPVGDGRL